MVGNLFLLIGVSSPERELSVEGDGYQGFILNSHKFTYETGIE